MFIKPSHKFAFKSLDELEKVSTTIRLKFVRLQLSFAKPMVNYLAL